MDSGFVNDRLEAYPTESSRALGPARQAVLDLPAHFLQEAHVVRTILADSRLLFRAMVLIVRLKD